MLLLLVCTRQSSLKQSSNQRSLCGKYKKMSLQKFNWFLQYDLHRYGLDWQQNLYRSSHTNKAIYPHAPWFFKGMTHLRQVCLEFLVCSRLPAFHTSCILQPVNQAHASKLAKLLTVSQHDLTLFFLSSRSAYVMDQSQILSSHERVGRHCGRCQYDTVFYVRLFCNQKFSLDMVQTLECQYQALNPFNNLSRIYMLCTEVCDLKTKY